MIPAQFLLQSGRVPQARDVLARAIAGGQGGAPAHSLLGLVLHQLGDLKGCHRELRQAVHAWRRRTVRHSSRWLPSPRRWARKKKPKAPPAAPSSWAWTTSIPMSCWGGCSTSRAGLRKRRPPGARRCAENPTHAQAQRELAGLVWMQTGDLARARTELDAAPQTHDIVAGDGEAAAGRRRRRRRLGAGSRRGRPRSLAECAGGAHRLEIRSAGVRPAAGGRAARASRRKRAPRRKSRWTWPWAASNRRCAVRKRCTRRGPPISTPPRCWR